MAIIVCTECGKRFSDKAASCPECGCPTADIIKRFNSTARAKEVGLKARKAIFAEVDKAKQMADSANKMFDRRNDAIQSETSRSIDLFSEDAASRAIGIIAKAKRACDDLYASLQALVTEVDSVCRPYLADNPGADAIKAVADLITSLNDDSEIENSGAMTFDGTYIGDASAATYMPGVQARMIQKFWESQYLSTPEGIAAEAKKRKATEENRRKREIEKKKQEERKAAAKSHMDKVVTECRAKVSLYQHTLEKECSSRLKQVLEKVTAYRDQLISEKADLEHELAGLGTFRMRERREKKAAIRQLDIRIAKLSDKGLFDAEKARQQQRVADAVKQYNDVIERYLNMRFPNRLSLKKPQYSWSRVPDTTLEDAKQASIPCPEPPDPSVAFDGKI